MKTDKKIFLLKNGVLMRVTVEEADQIRQDEALTKLITDLLSEEGDEEDEAAV